MKKNAYPIHPIRTEADYQAALQLVAPYFDKEPELDSDAGAHFEAMLTLIEAYEARHYPIAPPDPVEAIEQTIEKSNAHDQLGEAQIRATPPASLDIRQPSQSADSSCGNGPPTRR